MLSRRCALTGALGLAACQAKVTLPPPEPVPIRDRRIAAIEARIGGPVGLFALNTANGAALAHRAHERFARCSTFKLLLAAQILHMDQGRPGLLSEPIFYGEDELLSYAPVTRERFGASPDGRGRMTVEELCAATVITSDNSAANLLMAGPGMGPEGLTRFLRAIGDGVTRLDRYEIELNDVQPGDERDTTTPDAIVRAMARLLVDEDVLNPASREKLISWMVDSPTGRSRLRAGLPADWRAGDKTGTWPGEPNAANDVAIAWPPQRAPILIACYLSASAVEPAERNAAHAEIARIVVEDWG